MVLSRDKFYTTVLPKGTHGDNTEDIICVKICLLDYFVCAFAKWNFYSHFQAYSRRETKIMLSYIRQGEGFMSPKAEARKEI